MKRTSQPDEIGGPDFKRKKIGENTFVSVSPSTINITQLNIDVLRNIFTYCTLPDLYAFAKSSDQLKTLIVETGLIAGRIFDFTELSECCHILDVFKLFGQQMKRIKIGEMDIQYKGRADSKMDEILRLISTYCAVGTLKRLDLQYYYRTSIKKRYMYAALPFFQNIESFSLNETDPEGHHVCGDYFFINPAYNHSVNELVERIIGNATDLISIHLIRLKISGRFLFADHVRHNVKTLSIVDCNIRVPEALISYLNSAPKLVSFAWKDSSLLGKDTSTTHSSNIVYELVAKNVPDLEDFHYSQNEFFMTESNRCIGVPYFTFPNHQLLRNFGKLKFLELSTMDHQCLKLLAEMNQVEELKANFSFEENNFDFMNTFSNLKSVTFHTHQFGAATTHMNYLSKLPQLTKCHVSATTVFPTFHDVLVKAVESAKDLEILKISLSTGKLGIDLYSKLLNARLAHGVQCVRPLTVQLMTSEMRRFIGRLGPAYRPEMIEIQSVEGSK